MFVRCFFGTLLPPCLISLRFFTGLFLCLIRLRFFRLWVSSDSMLELEGSKLREETLEPDKAIPLYFLLFIPEVQTNISYCTFIDCF